MLFAGPHFRDLWLIAEPDPFAFSKRPSLIKESKRRHYPGVRGEIDISFDTIL